MGFIYKFIIMDTANVNANYYFVRSKRVSVHKLAQRLEDFCTGQRGRLNSLRLFSSTTSWKTSYSLPDFTTANGIPTFANHCKSSQGWSYPRWICEGMRKQFVVYRDTARPNDLKCSPSHP